MLLAMMVEYPEPHTHVSGDYTSVCPECNLELSTINMYSKCLYHNTHTCTCTCTCSNFFYKLVLNCEAGLAVFSQHP